MVLVTSDDDGQTWSGPRLVIHPPGPVRAYDPCLACSTHVMSPEGEPLSDVKIR